MKFQGIVVKKGQIIDLTEEHMKSPCVRRAFKTGNLRVLDMGPVNSIPSPPPSEEETPVKRQKKPKED